ncbi:MAG: helix-turn-helix transcriptional regulator [Anaerolineae bacterium]
MHRGGRQRGRGGRGQFAGGVIRRFLEPVLLLLLHRGDSHGYELASALEPFGLGDVAPGPVYRTLRAMEAAGLVQSEWDVESSGGPARRMYRLTQAGQRHLETWVEDLQETDRRLHHFLAAYGRRIEEG